MNHRAPLVLTTLLGVALGLLASGCKDEDTNLPFTLPLTPSPPLVTGPTDVFFSVRDVPGAPIQVSVQVSVDGGLNFRDATAVTGNPQLPGVLAQPEGATGSFRWNPQADLGPGIHRDVVLRVFGLGKELSEPGDTGRFVVDLSDRLDPLVPAGPALERPLAAPLPDGTVWVAGGLIQGQLQGLGYRWDPVTRTLGSDQGLGQLRVDPGQALLRGGQVLVAGGTAPGGALSAALELHRVDPLTGSGRTDLVSPGLQVARGAPCVAPLADGRGLVLGGETGGGGSTDLVEVVQPTAQGGTVQAGFSSSLAARVGATATALPDGRVLVAGGFLNGQPVLQCALLDAQGTALTPGPTLPGARGEHAAVLLPDGRVALVGGTAAPGSDVDALASALAFDPTSGGLQPLPGMRQARRGLGLAVAAGQVVAFGGRGPSSPQSQPERLELDLGQWFDVVGPGAARLDAVAVATGCGDALVLGGNAPVEVYTPDASLTSESFDALTTVPAPRADHTATPLGGGARVLIAGGTAGITSALATCELYDVALRSFTPRASLQTARAEHAAAVAGNGVLVVGGRNGQGVLGSAELWDEALNAWSPAGTLQVPRAGCSLTPLLDGRLLVAGGVDQAGLPVASLEVWDPASRSFSSGGALGQPRGAHQAVASFGDALLGPGRDALGQVTGVAVVLPYTLQVVDVALDVSRAGAALSELLPGTLLVAGGDDAGGTPRGDAAVVDARALPFTTLQPARALQVPRSEARAARLLFFPDVLLSGGRGLRGGTTDEGEIYRFELSPGQGSTRRTLDRRQVKARRRHTLSVLSTGQVLIVGGVDERGVTIAGAETYTR